VNLAELVELVVRKRVEAGVVSTSWLEAKPAAANDNEISKSRASRGFVV
jgi:hypothetical protein